MGSSTTQDLSYKSHRVLLANYFASQLVMWTNGRWHEQTEDAGLPSSGLGGNTSYVLFSPFKRVKESQRGDVALPSHTVSNDKAGTPPKTTPPPFPNTSELPQ